MMPHLLTKRSRTLRHLLAAREGVAAVEFAVTVPFLLTAIFGVIDLGRMMWAQNALHYSVEQAARCMTIDKNGTDCDTTAHTQQYAAKVSGMPVDSSVFTVTSPIPACGNQVTASYPFYFVTAVVNFSVTLSAQSCFPK